MNPLDVISKYYPHESEAYHILVTHSKSVTEKALAIAAAHPELNPDMNFIEEAAMLHDIGIFLCDAPEIDCHGTEPYIKHGTLGAKLMREEGYPKHARVCERHTGTGITAEMIEKNNLPLQIMDYTPETIEEKIICYADKFFSKTKLDKEKTVDKARQSLAKYGEETVRRFDEWHELFDKKKQ
jgi:uncharacterized protein